MDEITESNETSEPNVFHHKYISILPKIVILLRASPCILNSENSPNVELRLETNLIHQEVKAGLLANMIQKSNYM